MSAQLNFKTLLGAFLQGLGAMLAFVVSLVISNLISLLSPEIMANRSLGQRLSPRSPGVPIQRGCQRADSGLGWAALQFQRPENGWAVVCAVVWSAGPYGPD